MKIHSDISIERIVLGLLIVEPTTFTRYNSKLTSNLFWNQDHRVIFDTISQMWNTQQTFDVALLTRELAKVGRSNLDKYIVDLTMLASSSANMEYYIMVLVELSVKRDFIEKFSKLIKIASNPSEDIFHVRDKAFEYFDNLFLERFIEANKPHKGFAQLVDLVQEKAGKISKGEISGIQSSLSIINKAMGGWQDSDLIILAARPGMGKTAFIIQQIVDISKQGLPCGLFSLEMSDVQIAGRIVTNYTSIPNSSLLRKGMKNSEWQSFFDLKDSLASLKIHIDDTPALTIHELRNKARMMMLRENVRIIFVDYLQLMTSTKADNREQEIGGISRGLKALAKELNIPIIALSQLSRKVEDRPDKRPRLSDLRDSGAIEQDADEVIFLFRPEYYGIDQWDDEYNMESTEDQIEIIIQKNRQGGLLSERCKVNLPTSHFSDL